MPTGYTASVLEGATAKQFATKCMRAFGVCAHMRDDSWDKEVPRQLTETDSWHKEKLEEAEANLKRWHLMPLMDKMIFIQDLLDTQIARYEQEIAENEMGNLKLKKTFVLISHMAVPDELQNFKNFMLDQLDTSMENSDFYREEIIKLQGKTAEGYMQEHVDHLEWDVNYHRERLEEDKKRLVESNRVLALMWAAIDSIPE
jgi:hypothetical protein